MLNKVLRSPEDENGGSTLLKLAFLLVFIRKYL